MSKKYDNKILLYILLALLLIFGAITLYRTKVTDNTLNPEIVKIDTTNVNKIVLFPISENRKEIKFYKEGKSWKISNGKITSEPESNITQNLLGILNELKVKSLVSRSKSKWTEYQLTDSTATRVKVYEKDELVLDLMVGKFIYQQGNNQYGGMYGGGGSGISYIRLYGENDIYSVDGFLTFTFNQQFNNFRNQTLVRADKANISKISFKYPADSSFNLSVKDNIWSIDGQKADSTLVANYLSTLAFKNATTFIDDFVPSSTPVFQLKIEDKNSKITTIDAYIELNGEYVLNSNLNSKSWFTSNKSGVFNDIFKNKKNFFTEIGKKKK
jgi:multisubunit Na+/H+ antiporter MnhF subunit